MKMKTLHCFILAGILSTPQGYAQEKDDEILMTIHDRNISVGEFERIYKKNNSNTALEQQTVEEYLDLFINFKLKVIEAEEMGLDTTRAFLQEFNGYKKQLAKPYLSDQEEVDLLVEEAFERYQKEINASHILIRLNEYAGPEDTTLAWNKAMDIRNRLLAGEDFATVARAYSDDPSAKNNGGNLGWFTVFRMVYPFETAAYNTPKGGISLPARTRFGYHLIYVGDKRPARGEVQVAHIMVMVPESMTNEQKEDAKRKIYNLYDSLQSGMDFSELAMRHSEDRGSAGRGGELPWFGTGRMVPEFEDASFAIEKVGDISGPIQTSFGWHIIKLLDKKTYDDFETVKADLKASVLKSDRNAYTKIAMIRRIKDKNGFTEYKGNLREFYSIVDSTIFDRTWDKNRAAHLAGTLFAIGEREIPQQAFAEHLATHQGGRRMNTEVFVNTEYQKFVEQELLRYEEDQLPDKYPEFKHLVQEYHDGILLFDLTDKMVWSKAVEDTTGLEAFYAEHKDDYKWGKRMDATLYTCRDEEVAGFAKGLLENPRFKRLTAEDIQSRAYKEFSDSTCLEFEYRKLEAGDDELADKMDWSKDKISEIQERDGKFIFLVRNRILKPSVKRLDECRGLVTADYQNHLEKEWIELLRAKYPVNVNHELLSKIN
jgi:peptidyl-prolyl cis-trans isomerase SurA